VISADPDLRDAIQTADELLPAPEPADDAVDWSLGRESWTFHRWFFEVYGRPMHRGEYTRLMRQMFQGRKPEIVVAGVYRLAMRDGSPIVVTGYSGYQPQLYGVLPPDWQIGDPVPWQRDPNHVRHMVKPKLAPRVKAPAAAAPVAPPAQVAPAIIVPPVPEAAPRRKPTTLSIGGKNTDAVAALLEYRKRRWG
jgi:hypothetical protein